MKVVRERPCQRRYHRVTAPLWVRTPDGARVKAADWSLGDLRIDGWAGPSLRVGDEIALTLELPFQGFDISHAARCRLARWDPATSGACFEFVDLGERARDLMAHFIQDLIRGKMATVEDTICRIDVPVTPISTMPDPNPAGAPSTTRRSLKTLIYTLIYAVTGISVFAYLVLLLYTSAAQLEVESAVVSAPLQTLRMPVDGVLRPIALRRGLALRRGDAIAYVDDPALKARIEAAKRRLLASEQAMDRMEKRHRIEEERLTLYRVISRTEHDVALARTEGRRAALQAADAHLERVSALFAKGLTTSEIREAALERQIAAAAALREAEAVLERSSVMASVSERRHYNHKEFVVDLDLMEVELSGARAHRDAIARELDALQEEQRRRLIQAPFDGRVVQVYAVGDASVSRNAPVAVVERDGPTEVVAFLRQEEALQVALDQAATVYLPALDRLERAVVVAIDPNSAFLEDARSRFTWRSPQERTVAVTLRLTAEASVAERATRAAREIRAGAPAVVLFDRPMGRALRVWLSSLWPEERA